MYSPQFLSLQAMAEHPATPIVTLTFGHPMWFRLFRLTAFDKPSSKEVAAGNVEPDRIWRLVSALCARSCGHFIPVSWNRNQTKCLCFAPATQRCSSTMWCLCPQSCAPAPGHAMENGGTPQYFEPLISGAFIAWVPTSGKSPHRTLEVLVGSS
jgi:hypothetical protein